MSDLPVIDASPQELDDIRGFQEALAPGADAAVTAAVEPRYGILRSPDGDEVKVPAPLYKVLLQAAATLVSGYPVIVAPVNRKLTTQEAADLLNVSRPYLVRLLDRGDIPFEKVGRHRRVTFGDLMKYKQQRMADRRRSLENLIRESEELGLYDRSASRKPE